jgi:hypothetical protein
LAIFIQRYLPIPPLLRRGILAALVAGLAATNAATASPAVGQHQPANYAGMICIANESAQRLFLVAEGADGARTAHYVEPRQKICTKTQAEKGTVRVFENDFILEGCSRLTRAGQLEKLLAYSAYDNCDWHHYLK